MIRVVYVVPIIAPYAIPRYQELAKNKDVEVHVIAERDTNAERSGSVSYTHLTLPTMRS